MTFKIVRQSGDKGEECRDKQMQTTSPSTSTNAKGVVFNNISDNKSTIDTKTPGVTVIPSVSSPTKMKSSAGQWEDLRREARSMENELDSKLVSFSKLGANFGSRELGGGGVGPAGAAGMRQGSSTSDHLFPTMALEIEQLLERLSRVNEAMSDCLQSGNVSGGSSYQHTLQRHRDILQDYKQEFQKTRNNIVVMRERDDLLGSVQREIASFKSSEVNSRTSLLLSEHQRIHSSDRLLDDHLSVAAGVKENLAAQRGMLRGVQGRMVAMAARFPAFNSLIQRINFRRRRDTVILGSVIAGCLLIIIVYLFH